MDELEYPISEGIERGWELSPTHKENISRSQLNTTIKISDDITFTLSILKGAKKLGVEKRSSILAKLTKATETLVKTQRLIMGMDTDTGGIVNKGVIIIPGKVINWPDAAKREIDSAKRLLSADGEIVADSLEDEIPSDVEHAADDDQVETEVKELLDETET